MLTRRRKGITARLRARKRRKESIVAAVVRDLCVARDGYCRYGLDVSPSFRTPCRGESEWAHFGDHKRFKTRGLSPEERHTPNGSLMLCTRHHADYDAHRLEVTAASDDGCEGMLLYSVDDEAAAC